MGSAADGPGMRGLEAGKRVQSSGLSLLSCLSREIADGIRGFGRRELCGRFRGSFVPQRHGGIHARRVESWQRPRDQSDSEEQQRRSYADHRIRGSIPKSKPRGAKKRKRRQSPNNRPVPSRNSCAKRRRRSALEAPSAMRTPPLVRGYECSAARIT